jgi:two-component system nitrogen regulation response regulator GlnG
MRRGVRVSKLLVVDDEQSICWGLSRLGDDLGHRVTIASSAEEALEIVQREVPDVIVLDVRLPGMDGLAAMEHLRERAGDVPIIVITAYGDLRTAVAAVRQGAFDYIVKPFDVQRVRQALVRAFDARNEVTPRAAAAAVSGFVGSTPAMQEVFNQIALAAASNACVLLQGESGTGKELAARAIHQYSRHADGPFVPVSVAALNPALAESELFGHVRGAFTGADQTRIGYLQQANGGTLFLDEVAEIPLSTQVKLLRVLETGEVLPVGSSQPVQTRFRLISATHQDLVRNMQAGAFRHDLYFRLAAFRIEMPPLRRRPGDIAPLAAHFADTLAPEQTPPAGKQIAEELRIELERRPWYGNVRELRNAIEHALIVARGGTLKPEHLPEPIPATVMTGGGDSDPVLAIAAMIRQWTSQQLANRESPTQLHEHLLQLVEPPMLEAVLRHCHGQQLASARLLGMHRTTLRKKLEQYGLLPEGPNPDEE